MNRMAKETAIHRFGEKPNGTHVTINSKPTCYARESPTKETMQRALRNSQKDRRETSMEQYKKPGKSARAAKLCVTSKGSNRRQSAASQSKKQHVQQIMRTRGMTNGFQQVLDRKLQRLRRRCRTGYEVSVTWRPDLVKSCNGRKLVEEVIGDTIFIYALDEREAVRLVAHGFSEWLLNRHSRPYRDMINKLIELFETQQYQNKEEIVEALVRIL